MKEKNPENLEIEVVIKVGNRKVKYLIANMHNKGVILDRLEGSLKGLIGIKKVK